MRQSDRQGGGICFVATARSGLGHLRRVSTIARALRGRAPDRWIGLLTNAAPDGLEASDLAVFDHVEQTERAWMSDALKRIGPELAVFDTIVVPGAETLPQKLALILRETPADRLARFRLDGGRAWDAVLVPNPPDHWQPDPAEIEMAQLCPTGWIYRRGTVAWRPHDGPPRVLVATGGGGTVETAATLYPVIDHLIASARARAGKPLWVQQAIGPRARDFGVLDCADEAFDPGGRLNEFFAEADIVVSTAGYNSVLELSLTDTPSVLVPIPRSLDDQAARAALWGRRLGAWVDPSDRESAIDWLADRIERPRRRAPLDLGPGGEDEAAACLAGLLA